MTTNGDRSAALAQRRSLRDKVALVTGSTGGIGEAIAHRLAAEGAHVIVTGRRAEAGRAVEAAIVAEGGSASFMRLDVSDEAQVREAFSKIDSSFGRLDILVNNAAPVDLVAQGVDKPAADQTTAEADAILQPVLYGTYWASQHAIRMMTRTGGGSIVHMSSIAATVGLPCSPAYSMAKGAVTALSRQLAVDYAASGIRSNTIVIGFVISGEIAAGLQADPVTGPMLRSATLTRLGTPDDIADLVAFLASEQAGFLTGTTITADGGMTCSRELPDLSSAFAQAAAAAP